MVLAKIGDPFHLNIFPHMDVVRLDIYVFNSVIKLLVLRKITTMTQHRNISRFEELCLPTKLVHILYDRFVFYLIKHSFQISIKLRQIIMKKLCILLLLIFLNWRIPQKYIFLVYVIYLFLCLVFVVHTWRKMSIVSPQKSAKEKNI